MTKRPPVPLELAREVLIEAGHRCAIPTCRQTPVEIAHILAWAKTKQHRRANLIALCPTCHTWYDQGEIDRKSMLVYKQKLQSLDGRYGDFERRIMAGLARSGASEFWILSDLEILVQNLVDDGLLDSTGREKALGRSTDLRRRQYRLTERGRESLPGWTG